MKAKTDSSSSDSSSDETKKKSKEAKPKKIDDALRRIEALENEVATVS